MPLSLTLLSAAVPPERRNQALGVWGAIGGLAVAAGPLVGGRDRPVGWSWQCIFWINVPVGVVLFAAGPVAAGRVHRDRASRLDLGGVVLATIGLARRRSSALVRGNAPRLDAASVCWRPSPSGVLGLAGSSPWESAATHPMLPFGCSAAGPSRRSTWCRCS